MLITQLKKELNESESIEACQLILTRKGLPSRGHFGAFTKGTEIQRWHHWFFYNDLLVMGAVKVEKVSYGTCQINGLNSLTLDTFHLHK